MRIAALLLLRVYQFGLNIFFSKSPMYSIYYDDIDTYGYGRSKMLI